MACIIQLKLINAVKESALGGCGNSCPWPTYEGCSSSKLSVQAIWIHSHQLPYIAPFQKPSLLRAVPPQTSLARSAPFRKFGPSFAGCPDTVRQLNRSSQPTPCRQSPVCRKGSLPAHSQHAGHLGILGLFDQPVFQQKAWYADQQQRWMSCGISRGGAVALPGTCPEI